MKTSTRILLIVGLSMTLLAACSRQPPPPPIQYVEPTPTCHEQWVHMPMMINFPTGGATISSQDREILREMVVSASQRTDIVRVRVEGHTDTCGNEMNNQILSQNRATSVAQELVNMNVPAERIDTVGFGSLQPRTDENCGRGQSLSEQTNRRVEFSLMVCR